MRGRIEDGQLVTLAPVRPEDVRADDVVLVVRKGNYWLHLVKEVRGDQSVFHKGIFRRIEG